MSTVFCSGSALGSPTEMLACESDRVLSGAGRDSRCAAPARWIVSILHSSADANGDITASF